MVEILLDKSQRKIADIQRQGRRMIMLFLSILQRIRCHFVCGCEDRNAPEAERWSGPKKGLLRLLLERGGIDWIGSLGFSILLSLLLA